MDTNMDAAGQDPFEDLEQGTVETPPEPVVDNTEGTGNDTPPQSGDDDSFIRELLASNGIADPSKIKFEDDEGKVIERNWNELSNEEKLSIITTSSGGSTASEVPELSQEEMELITQIRDSQQSPADYLASLERKAAEAVSSEAYDIDGITDDELFVLDALDKYGDENITDEQLDALLKNAKSDPDLYEKTIASLRTQYKQREDDLRLQKQQQDDAQQEQEYRNFSESILSEIQSLTQVAGQAIELSTDDMNDLANYILTRDEEGNSEFGKAMNNPKIFTQVAFWALKGNDIMSEISSQIKLAYEQGLAAGKKGQSTLAFSHKKDNPAQNNSQLGAFALDVN